MRSIVLPLPPDLPAREALAAGRLHGDEGEDWTDADLVLAALPPDDDLPATLAAVAERFPGSRIAGCEAVTQFAGDGLTTAGVLHLFRFDGEGAGVDLLAFRGEGEEEDDGAGSDVPGEEERVAILARRLAAGDPVLLLADGLRCPVEGRLARVRRAWAEARGGAGSEPAGPGGGRDGPGPPPLAGGLASQEMPGPGPGARVFRGRTVLDGGCVAVVFRGVDAVVRVVRGWEPASPVYRVTRARGHVLHEIDGEAASDWFRRFFTVDGRLAPLPDTAPRFPLILAGPDPAREGLYRSMRAFDEPPGAVTFWGDLETGDRVRLGMGHPGSLVDRAAREVARDGFDGRSRAAVLYSCVGRQQVLGEAASAEVRAVHQALGGLPLSGFFSFGEIGPTAAGGPAFYNHTAVLVVLAEREVGGVGDGGAEGAR